MQTKRFQQEGSAHQEPRLSLTIGTDGSGIPLRDLARFFELLRAAYVRCLWVKLPDPAKSPSEDAAIYQQVAEIALANGPSLRGYTLDAVGGSDLPSGRDLLLLDIRRENPLELVLGGVGVALAAAVIISGGEVKVGVTGIHFKVNSLGDGIKKIKAAFSKKSLRSGAEK